MRVGDREVDDGVDPDDEVVLGDHGLGRERDDLLAQVDQRLDAIDERDDQRQPGVERARVAPEPLDDPGPRLRHDPHARRRDDEQEHGQDDQCDDAGFHDCLLTSRDERRGAPDLDHVDALAGLDDVVLVVGARGPDLALDADAADALVVGDALDDHRRAPDQRRGAGAQRAAAGAGASARAAAARPSRTTETTRNATQPMAVPAPRPASSAATSAPPANGARKKPSVAISPTPKTTAAISQISQGSMSVISTNRGRRGSRSTSQDKARRAM